MSDNPETQYCKTSNRLCLEHEESQISVARRKKVLYRRSNCLLHSCCDRYIFNGIDTHFTKLNFGDKKDEKEQVQQELVSLEKEESLLKDEIVKLNDDDYIGKLARKEYFLSDDNEIIFTLPEKKDKEEEEKENPQNKGHIALFPTYFV